MADTDTKLNVSDVITIEGEMVYISELDGQNVIILPTNNIKVEDSQTLLLERMDAHARMRDRINDCTRITPFGLEHSYLRLLPFKYGYGGTYDTKYNVVHPLDCSCQHLCSSCN